MLKRKMLRDIKKYKVQFIPIFLMAFIGVAVFTGMYMDTNSFKASIDEYYGETNLADGWIYSDYLVDEFINQVYLLGATTQMERQLVVDSKAELDNHPDVVLHFVENNTISKYYPIDGEPLNINDSAGVWLDKSFADARNLKIGDEITFQSRGYEITKVIKGLGYSPEYVYDRPISSTVPNHTLSGFAYMSYKAFPSDNMLYNVLNVKFDGTPEIFSMLLSYRLNGYYTTFLEKSNHYSVDVVAESISQLNSLSAVFPAIFIIISMLMLLTTEKRIISHQRTQIGVLKANGFKNNAIALHYILPGFLVVTAGSIVGAIFGPVIFHALSNPSRIFYFKFPYWHSLNFIYSLLLIPLMGALSVAVSYFSIKNIVNEPPSKAIKPKVPLSSTASFIEKLKIWEMLSFNFRWNFRNVRRNKFRAVMTIFGVIGCTVLLISGFGLYEKINESKDWYFDDVIHFDSKLILESDVPLSQINSIAEKVNGIPIMESSVEIVTNKTDLVSLLVLNDNDLMMMTDDNHNKIKIEDGEVSISKKLAETMNITVGDTINCRFLNDDKDIKVKIDKIHSSPFSQGIVMSPNKLKELGFNYTPTSIITSQHVSESYDGVLNIQDLNDLIDGWDKMEATSVIIITALIFFAVILAIVILYNLNLLSFTEMENDIATLKVLGFKSSFLTKLLATQGLSFIIIGFLLGMPISYYVLSALTQAFGDLYFMPSLSIITLSIVFIIIISISVIMDIFFSRKIKELDMVN